MKSTLSNEYFQKVDGLCRNSAEKTFAKTRQSHLEKLEKLIKKANVSLRPGGTSKWVINRTQRDLTKAQKEVLALGLNFTPVPSRVPVSDIATAIESGTRGLLRRKLLGKVEVNDLRGRICGALKKLKPPSTNMTKEQKSALKDLRAMEGVTILPADKGKATVVMEREEYDSKMMELLLSSTYRKLPTDPTQTMENKKN